VPVVLVVLVDLAQAVDLAAQTRYFQQRFPLLVVVVKALEPPRR
jgi:hypothetical protein